MTAVNTAFRLTERMKSLEGPLPFRRYAKLILTEDGEKLYEPMNAFDEEIERQIAGEFAVISSSFPRCGYQARLQYQPDAEPQLPVLA